jgi:hypothetical protein
MARIQAGSTLVNQYAPPFVVSDSVANGWELRWNETLLAFEAYDPSATIVEGGFSSIESSVFLATRQQVFVVPWAADSKQSLVITIDGVKQNQTAYTVSIDTDSNTTTITLDEDLADVIEFPTAPNVEILGLQAEGGAQVLVYQETASNATQSTQVLFPLTGTIGWYPPSRESLIITFDGIKQAPNTYFIVPNANFTGAQVQFVTAPAAITDVDIEILGITTTGETIASPVQMLNLDNPDDVSTFGLFDSKSITGDEQIFSFKSITRGSKINLAPSGTGDSVQISAIEPVFTPNITVAGGAGLPIVDTTTATTATTVEFRGIVGGDGITVSSNATDVTISKSGAYQSYSGTPVPVASGQRVVGLTHTGTPLAVTLPALADFYDGETITVKRENGGTDVITISTAGAETIDGAATYQIASPYGYVTLYKSATQFHVISTSE